MRLNCFSEPASIYIDEIEILLISWETFGMSKYLSFWFTDGSGGLFYGINRGSLYPSGTRIEDIRFTKFSYDFPQEKRSMYGKSFDRSQRHNLNKLNPTENCKHYLLHGQEGSASPHIDFFFVKDLENVLEFNEKLNHQTPLLNDLEVDLIKRWIRIQKINKIID